MRKTYLLSLLCFLGIASQTVSAQVSGTKTIGVDYATVAAAVTALNTAGVSGNVIINVPVGYTETAPAGGYQLGSSVLNSSTSSTSTLTFQKSGTTGANPLLTAPVGTSTSTDGIFVIKGTDYVTINGIDLIESSGNTTATTQMEWGYALLKRQNVTPFDGCQNVTIQNCTITLNKTNTASVGIYSGNHIVTSTTALSITSTTDATNNCTFSGNNISNVNRCISLSGFTTAASPYTLYDQNNTVGGTSSNNGNALTNFGGTATVGYGIYFAGQNNALAGYNTITSATTPGTANVFGIFHGVGTNSNFTVSNNTFQLTQGASAAMCGIANGTGAANTGISGATASIIISANTFQNFSFTAANSTIQYLCLYNYAGTTSGWDLGSLKLLGNTVKNFNLNGTGTHYYFYNYYCNSNDVRFNDNKITRNRRTSTSGSTYIYYNYYGNPTGGADSVMRNRISENYAPGYIYAVYDYMSSATTTRDRVIMYDTLMYDTTAAATTGYLYGLYTYGGKDVTLANNYVANNYNAPSGSGYIYGIAANYGNNVTLRDNIYTNNVSYGHYCVYETNSYVNVDVYNNTITNSTGSTGTNYNIYSGGDGTGNIYNNTVANCGVTGTGAWYGIYHNSGVTSNIHDNTIYNISGNGGALYGIYSLGGTTANYYNNNLGKLVNSSTTGGNVAGLYATSGTTINFYDNIVDTVTTAYSSGTAYGVYESGPTNLNCYRNKISYIASFGASGSVNGIYLNSGTTNVYNNLIGNLQLPASSSISGTNLVGIYCGVGNTTTGHTLSYNTVVLNASTSGTAYSSSALFANTTYPVRLNNNIFINTSQQSGTGTVSAYRRSSTTATSHNGLSNNNLFYAGTPGSNRAILFDGTTNYSTIPTYRAVVSPADVNSVTENTSFQSLTGIGTNFLRPILTASTQIESNAVNIAGITNDIYLATRAGNIGYSGAGAAPDMGAVEDNYMPLDLSAPAIVFTPLAVTCATGNRTFTATVSDVTGVASGSLSPRVYYRKGSGSWYSSPGTLSSGTTTSGTWTFTIVATDMGGLATSDVISYYVIAQDLETISNIGSYPAGVVATDVNTITTHPVTPNTYAVAPSLSGTYNIGVGQTYTTITSAVNDYNNFCISGPVVFQLTDATYPGETFPITINNNAFASATNTLTIRPASGISPVITGSAAAIFKLNGADYVTIDGSNAGTTSRNLTIASTSTTTSGTAVIWIASTSASDGATNNTIKNCIISGNSSTTTEMCIFSGAASGSGAFNAGYNSLTANSNNTIRNNAFMKSQYGVWLKGTSTSTLDQDTRVENNNFGTATAGEGFNAGGLVLQFHDNAIVSGNDIQNVVGTGGVNNAAANSVVFTGLYIRQCTNASVSGNKIHRMTLSTTANRVHMLYVESPAFSTSSSPSNNLIVNNAVYDGHANATGATTWTISGISANGGYGDKFYYNTVNLTGVVNVSAGPAAAFSNGNALTLVVTSNIDVRNNVFVIDGSSTGTSATFFATYWRTAAAVTSSVTDYNDLRSAISSGGTAYTGYNATNRSSLADWQTASSQDANSINFDPVFAGSDDPHLSLTPVNLPLAAATPIAGITTDMDGTTRSTSAPVMGVHEVNFSAIPPIITYTALLDACSTGNRTVTATIGDVNTGIPTSGTLVPRIYYRKGSGTWYSQPGTLTSGSGSSGTWSFTIVSSDMTPLAIGDIVSYYIIAQTNAGIVGSIPSAGLAATNVNTVSAPPTSSNTYEILPTLNGTYTVGTGGSYATITAAVNAYNNTCLGGPVVFELIDPTYGSAETFPIVINNHPMAGPGTTLTIRPAAAVAATVTGSTSNPAIFKLLNARYITLDGVNIGGRSLSLINSNTGTGTTAVWLASTATTGPGNDNISLLNMNITGGATNTTNWGIVAGVDGTSPAATNGMDNDNVTIQGNTIKKCGYAIMAMGVPTTNTLDGWVIRNNILGPSVYSATDNLGYNGVFMRNMTSTVVSGNTMQHIGFTTLASQTVGIYMETNVDGIVIDSNIVDSVLMNGTQTGTSSVCGFYLGTNVKNATISRNRLSSIYNLNTTGYGARGITVNNATAASNVTIVNNFVSDISSYSDATVTNDWPIGIGVDGTSGGVNIYHNSINLYGPHAGVTTASGSTDIFIAATGGSIDVRNNILANSYDNTSSTTDRTYAIYSTAANTVFSNIDYNDYYTSGGAAKLGYIGSADRTTLADMVTGFGGNTHSISSSPLFISLADLHLQPFGANLPLVAGTPITAVPADIDGTTRSTATPVMGANEVNIPPCSGVPTPGVVTATALSGCATFNSNLTLTGSTTGAGITLQWQSSTDSSSWTNIAGETDLNYSPTTTATTFYRTMVTCAISTLSAATPGRRLVSYPFPVIAGSGVTCAGGSVTLSATPAGGTWASGQTSTATIDAVTGAATGAAVGTAPISYTSVEGCTSTVGLAVVSAPSIPTVTPSTAVICEGASVSLSAASAFNGTAAINSGTISLTVPDLSATGAFSPLSVSLPAGATITSAAVSLNATMTYVGDWAINLTAPNGNTLNLFNRHGTSGDNFVNTVVSSSGSTAFTSGAAPYTGTFAATAATGSIGITAYPVTVTTWSALYSVPSGTWILSLRDLASASVGTLTSWSITLNYTLPSDITWSPMGTLYTGSDLSTPYAGSTTTSVYAKPAAPGTVATVNTYTATASIPGCGVSNSATGVVTVNPLPSPIVGSNTVCHGLTTTLSDPDAGGTWTSSHPAFATISATTGIVNGVAPGTSAISYTFTGTGCTRSTTLTVNALPDPITGTASVCQAATTTLSSGTSGGTWSSGTTPIATINASSGAVSGVTAGLSVITYVLPTSCIRTREVTVNPLPVINITPSASAVICDGESASFGVSSPLMEFSILSQDFNLGLGTWTISTPVDPLDGLSPWLLTSVSAMSISGDGTPMVEAAPSASLAGGLTETYLTSPSFSTVGFGSANLTFNEHLYSTSASDVNVKVQYSIDGGSSWNILADQLPSFPNDTLVGSGSWSASGPEVNISLPAAALNVPDVRLRWFYETNWGGWWEIDNIAVKAALPAATFTWAGVGTADGLSCTSCTTPTITPTTAGTNTYNVTASSTCSTTNTVTVNVNPLPVITGASGLLCTGKTITLGSTIPGGAWTSSDNTVATVDATTGAVTGVAAGPVVISYTLPTTCGTAVTLNVNQSPGPITGALHICEGLTTALGNSEGSGSWSSGALAIVTINSASGLATAINPGTSTITYALPSGCQVTAVTTVDLTPAAFSGSLAICQNATTSLGVTPTGGTWVSDAPAIATVNISSGVVAGVASGTANIVYTSTTGCERTEVVTVNGLPADIGGTTQVCLGLLTTLTNTTGTGTWSSSDMAVATIDAGGAVTGVSHGNSTISYIITATGCYKTQVVTVNPLPDPIPGPITMCEGLSTTLSNTPAGGTWLSSDLAVATIDATTGVLSGVAFGNTNITYTLPTGCISSTVATVNPLPVSTTGTLQVCVGLTTNLVNTTGGGTWSSEDVLVADVDATGMTTGNTAGTANIIYTLPTGCLDSVTVTVNPLPGPIVGTLEVCEGLTASLTNTVPDGTWTSSAPLTAGIDLLTGAMTGAAAGNAAITYTLLTGCLKVANATVNALPAIITGTMDMCQGSTTTLSSTPAGTWSNDLSGMAAVDAAGVVTGVAGGTASITYTLGTGCMRAAEVTVNMLPAEYAMTGGGGYCAGTAGTLVGLGNSDIDVSYDLYQGSALMGSEAGTGAAISFGSQSVVGTYTVFATNTVTGCVNDMAGSAVITITPLNIPSVTVTTAATTVCSGIAITYTATPVNGGTLPAYNWEVNGAPVFGVTSATYTYIPVNGDIVKATLNSNAICAIPATATDTLTMTVNPAELPVATISVPTTTVCAGSGASFSVAPTFGGATPSYEWFVNGTTTGVTSTVYTYTPANGDAVTCKMGSSFTCRLADTVISNSLLITTTPISLPIVSLAVSPGAVINYGTPVTFSATVTGIGTATPSYQWVVNSTVQPGATSSTFTSSTLNNNDSVTCRVNISDPCGFENFNSIVMRVKKVGVSELFGAGSIMLVPNPNRGAFVVKGTVASQNDEEVFVEVVDMLGQIVYKGHMLTKNGALNERIQLSNTLANGMYMLNLRAATESAVFHFVLEQ